MNPPLSIRTSHKVNNGKKYESFWLEFLERLDKKQSTIMSGRVPSKKHWQQTRGKVHITASLRKNDSFVQLCIEKTEASENTEIFEKLSGYKGEINNKFGEPIIWQRKPEAKRCTVSSQPYALGIDDTEKKEELLEILSDSLIRLNTSLEPYYG